MNRKSLVLATLVSVAGFAAHAESPDLSGQFAATVTRPAGTADAGQRSRAEVQAEYVRNRDAVRAMTAEDSGSSVIAGQTLVADEQVAGAAVTAQ